VSFIHSIKFRFTLWYLLVLVILLVLLSTGVYLYLSYTLYHNLDSELELRASQLSSFRDILDTVAEGRFEEEIGEVVAFYFHSGDELLRISPRDIDITLDNELVDRAISGQAIFATIVTAEEVELRIYAAPFSQTPPYLMARRPESPLLPMIRVESAALIIGRPTKAISQALSGLLRTLAIAVPLTMLLAGGGGVWLARRAFRPVDRMSQTAREIEATDLSRRLEVSTKDELGRLALTLNQMIQRLQKAFQRQREFTSDASHELRAPLAVIQAESTLALHKDRSVSDYRQSLETISQEVANMSRVIDQLLTLARADEGRERFACEEIDLGEVLRRLSVDIGILCEEKGLEFNLNLIDGVKVDGDAASLRQLFRNILDNAIRYTPPGGTISVSLTREGPMAVVADSDTGMGIPPEDMAHIFERFYRVDKARSRAQGGSGLGLAIAKYIAEAHHGNIEVTSKVGRGSTFTVRLPMTSHINQR